MWCDQKATESEHVDCKHKRESESILRRRKWNAYTELVEKHGKSEYSIPLLQLWARAIATDNHDD